MTLIADLHIHSKYSRGCSNDLDLKNLEKYACMKGVGLLGTGDFTHPKWAVQLKENLTDDGTGILRTTTGFPFIAQTEISLVYSQGGRGRRVHNVVLAPNLETASQITEELKKRGRVDYDGRPIFKIPRIDFVELMRNVSKDVEVIPAHIWTPWFSLFGSKSGFDSINEAFGDQVKHINAVETGLSSDPPMNWRIKQLDRFATLSFSDLHSYWPWRIGREATLFDLKNLTYANLIKAIRTRNGLSGTIEVDPAYGKYHEDGHRNCNVCLRPEETKKLNGLCPVCKKPVTIGVHNRVEELADREPGFKPENAKPFYRLIPLSELLCSINGKGVATKFTWQEYFKILTLGSELDILLNKTKQDLLTVANEQIVNAIIQNRSGNIAIKPGYDGEYGVPIIGKNISEESMYYKVDPELLERLKSEKPNNKKELSNNTNKKTQIKPQKTLGDF